MSLSRLSNLTGNMHNACRHAANGVSKTGLTRREIVSQIKAKHDREELIEKFRAKGHPLRRVARVTRKKAGLHVTGFGIVSDITLNELKTKLGANGFTDYLATNFGTRKVENLFS